MIPWWGVLLIAIGALGLGGLVAFIALGIYIARGINW